MGTKRGLLILSEALPVIGIHLTNNIEQSSSNGCHYLQNSIPFHVLRGCSNFDILYEIEISFQQNGYGVDHKGITYDIRSSYIHSYIPKEDYGSVKQQWMYLLAEQHPFSHTERVPEI